MSCCCLEWVSSSAGCNIILCTSLTNRYEINKALLVIDTQDSFFKTDYWERESLSRSSKAKQGMGCLNPANSCNEGVTYFLYCI